MAHFEHWYLMVLALIVGIFLPAETDAGCTELGRCCTGQNADCRYVYPSGRHSSRACYCDDFCRKSGDCCSDYKERCLNEAQDCIMTYWSHWSHCTARCGRGIRERRRQIHIPASGGGEPCGKRRQTRACYHNDARCRNSEIAQILPAYLNRKRNIPDKYERPSEVKKVRRNSYCVHYRIVSIAWSCRYASPYHVLKVGSEVCAECHNTAMDKKGYCKGSHTGVRSRWMALVGRPCHGTWKSEGEIEKDCKCGEQHGKDFIFI
uniref:Somatomedin-B and thrombospondin type-1 domain-containing protein n=1 Tax=Phallusia mammillata TaxID=59560 RepID=A0A6F9DRY5_9ASCI|nr:somatomedin-B and thrombospondin type-1 domain-containing protein [Phallusia mammillata]